MSRGSGDGRSLVVSKAPTGWTYVDLSGRPRGPFPAATVAAWIREGGFRAVGDDLRVARTRPPLAPAATCDCVLSDAFSRLGDVRAKAERCDRDDCEARRVVARAPPGRLDALATDAASSDDGGDSSDDGDDSTDELFRVVGYVDGICDEVDASDEDAWALRPVVVEIKNRMTAARDPQLHDQLQIVAYLQMTGCAAGDLVQRVRTSPDAPVRVDRIDLSDFLEPWRTIVTPRLYGLAEAVDAIRRDDDRRRAWLLASPRERWMVAARLCDWLPEPPFNYGADAPPPPPRVASPPPPRTPPRDDDDDDDDDGFWREAARLTDAIDPDQWQPEAATRPVSHGIEA